MKALTRLRMKRIFEGRPLKAPALHSLYWAHTSAETARELLQGWEKGIVAPVADLMVSIANANDDEVSTVRKLIPPKYDIAHGTDSELTEFRDQLRTVWSAIEKGRGAAGEILGGESEDQVSVYLIVHKWWERYSLDSDGWMLFWETGIFLPTQKNFRAIVGRICYEKSHLLGRCLNPDCRQFFIKRRVDQKFCLEKGCLQYGNRERVKKSKKKKAKTHKAEARKSKRSA